MALNIKNAEVEQLVTDVAGMTGESKTEAVRQALVERRERLSFAGDRGRAALEFLEREVWPNVPADLLGKGLSKEEVEEILGFGPDGV